MEIRTVLKEWGFEKYVDQFIEHEVDLEALHLLDESQIKTLIPAIGPQAKFKKALAEWKVQATKINSDNSDNEELRSMISAYGASVDGLTPSLTSPLCSPSTSSRSDSSTISQISDQKLAALLTKTPDGKVLLELQEAKPLGEQLRKILIGVISKEFEKTNPQAPVTAAIYHHWLQEIKTLFPAENTSVYYTKSEGVHRAYGRLFDAVTNLKAKYRRNKVYQPRCRRSLDKTLTPTPSASDHLEDLVKTDSGDEELDAQDIEDCLEWLRSSVDDYDQCAEKWHKTQRQRMIRVLSNEKKSYLDEFPCLKRSWGHNLLIADFDRWYPGNKSALDDKLPLLKVKVLAASEKISRKSQFVIQLKTLARESDMRQVTLQRYFLYLICLDPFTQTRRKPPRLKCATALSSTSRRRHSFKRSD